MKIIAVMVLGPKERLLTQSLKNLQWVDEWWVCGNNLDEESKKIVKDFGCHYVEDNSEWGKFQNKIKQDLFDNHLKPRLNTGDWIIWKDCDEIFDNFTRSDAEALAKKGGTGYSFYVVNLLEGGYSKTQSFWNTRMWQYNPEWNNTWQARNLHCGNYPIEASRYANFAPFILLHYGLMDKELRERKSQRYKKYDPDSRWMRMNNTYYEFLESSPAVTELDIEKLRQEVAEYAKNTYFKTKENNMTNETMHNFRRKLDGMIFAVPENQVAEHKNRKKSGGELEFEYVGVMTEREYVHAEAPVVEAPMYEVESPVYEKLEIKEDPNVTIIKKGGRKPSGVAKK